MRQPQPLDRRRSLALAGQALAGLLISGRTAAQSADPDPLFDAQGFRQTRYRAPVDLPPAPAETLSLDAALRLHPGRDALFLDVLPAQGAQRDPATDAWLSPPAHDTIPGALWLPEVGRTSPDPVLWAGLLSVVRAARARHPRWPVVVFCRADCWMSWNAARRLAFAGVPEVFWLAEGIDGWHDRHRALAPALPQATPP